MILAGPSKIRRILAGAPPANPRRPAGRRVTVSPKGETWALLPTPTLTQPAPRSGAPSIKIRRILVESEASEGDLGPCPRVLPEGIRDDPRSSPKVETDGRPTPNKRVGLATTARPGYLDPRPRAISLESGNVLPTQTLPKIGVGTTSDPLLKTSKTGEAESRAAASPPTVGRRTSVSIKPRVSGEAANASPVARPRPRSRAP